MIDQLDPRIIIALDYPDKKSALTLVDQLDPKLCRLKVGKAMFTHYGPDFVKQLMERGFGIFLDLKFHDIPNQVAGACKAAAELGVWMITVHALGGLRMLTAARESVDKIAGPKPLIMAITLLTSMEEQDIHEIGLAGSIETNAVRLAKLAQQAGLDGVVCSAHEAASLRAACGTKFYLVSPGIRLETDAKGDQKRVMTPREAMAAGVNYLVIGRSITAAANPLQALQEVQKQLSLSKLYAV